VACIVNSVDFIYFEYIDLHMELMFDDYALKICVILDKFTIQRILKSRRLYLGVNYEIYQDQNSGEVFIRYNLP